MPPDALAEIDRLFHISTTYNNAADSTTPPTACTVTFALRGMPTHPVGEKPSLIDCSHNPAAEIAIQGSDYSLQHWLTFPDSYTAYAPRETFAQAALEAAAENLPAAA